MKQTLLFSILVLIIASCKTLPYDPSKDSNEKLFFGTEGGFAGSRHEFVLNTNGMIYRKDDKGYKKCASIAANEVQQIFLLAQKSKVFSMDLNQPGNMSKFLEFQTLKQTKRLVWNVSDKSIPSEVNTFFTMLNKKVSKD